MRYRLRTLLIVLWLGLASLAAWSVLLGRAVPPLVFSLAFSACVVLVLADVLLKWAERRRSS
jgi:hypothetical protein